MAASVPSVSRAPTQASNFDGLIGLTDNTEPREPVQITDDDSSGNISPTLSKIGTSQRIGLREQIARRKYAKYQEEKYRYSEDNDEENGETGGATSSRNAQTATTSSNGARPGLSTRASTFQRGHRKIKSFLSRKQRRATKEGDAQTDVLYENQRGMFFFGTPYYSSNSLLNFDPSAWTTSEGKPSPVNITNAQLPDPDWEWVWKTWYVDMSGDVDEHGWQYSFMFQVRFPWHGNHPWFHSFARRRRWIRERVRKHKHNPDGTVEGGRTMQDAHKLNADYFTIHPSKTLSSQASSYTASITGGQESVNQTDGGDDYDDDDDESVDNISQLMLRLKKTTIDREKIRLVSTFMDHGGQDLYYLADKLPEIMSLFVFDYSRQQLVKEMLRRVDGLEAQDGVKDKSSSSDNPGDDEKATRVDNVDEEKRDSLFRALKAADGQVKQLEYWSDIKQMVEKGETLTGDDDGEGWDERWQGLGSSGPAGSRQGTDLISRDNAQGKGKGKA